MSERQLYFGPRSPFGRAVRIILIEKGLSYEHAGRFPDKKISPTTQVPALIENGQVFWDSSTIIEHLMSAYPNVPHEAHILPLANTLIRPDKKLNDTQTLTTLHTLGTCLTTLFQFCGTFEGHSEHTYIIKCVERSADIFAWCESQIETKDSGFLPDVMSIADIRLVTLIGFIDRGYIDLDWRSFAGPKVISLVRRLEERPSFINTQAPMLNT